MRRCFLSVCLTICLTAAPTRAADPKPQPESPAADKTATTAATEVTEPVIAQRELKFDVSEELDPLRLDVQGSYNLEQLIEQNYVARFSLVTTEVPQYHRNDRREWTFKSPHFDRSPTSRTDASTGGKLADAHALLYHSQRSLQPVIFKDLLSRMPQERRPSEDVVGLLTTNPSLHIRRTLASIDYLPGPPERKVYQFDFEVLAPTAQRARELTEGFFALIDYGFFLPYQQECIRGKQTFAKDASLFRAELQQLREELDGIRKEREDYEEYKDISMETLVEFTAQIRLISVEMAGVQARLDACDKILAAHQGLATPRFEQVETLKITAEIELVGLAARKAALEEIAKKGRGRIALLGKESSGSRSLASKEKTVAAAEEGITHYEAQRLRVVPYPVKDGKVTIRRIKWESSEKPDTGGDSR